MWGTLIVAVSLLLLDSHAWEDTGTASPFKIYVACGFHGREWATVELCKSMKERVQELASQSSRQNPMWTEWFFDENVNPDGVEMARSGVNPCQRGNSRGVDINRNFPPIERCPSGNAPAFPPFMRKVGRDAENYPGPYPLSEPESRAVVSNLREFQPDVALFIHTGTSAIFMPYDSCFEPAPDVVRVMQEEFARDLAKSVGLVPGRIGRSTGKLAADTGTATDYAFAHLDIPFVFTVETYEMPLSCTNAGHLLRKATANMTYHECEQVFVPHSKSDGCNAPAMNEYLQRWTRMVDGIEDMVKFERDRRALEDWLDKRITPMIPKKQETPEEGHEPIVIE